MHIGIIMDGNGRWVSKGLPRSFGYEKVQKMFQKLKIMPDLGIKTLTFMLFLLKIGIGQLMK